MAGISPNKKAIEGRARKAAQKEVKKNQKKQEEEEKLDKQWSEGVKGKSAKKINEEIKHREKMLKKDEKERLLALEEAELAKYDKKNHSASKGSGGGAAVKVEKPIFAATPSSTTVAAKTAIILNDGKEFDPLAPTYTASSIDDALFLLDANVSTTAILTPTKEGGSSGIQTIYNEVERHPERRAKAAYAAWEAIELPKMKMEYPSLRMSQMKERLMKAWGKSPENPFNQTHISFNATKSQEIIKTVDENLRNLERLRFKEDK